jgi:ubiquinone/menaquinone biosynthesis C-methylase UbiE
MLQMARPNFDGIARPYRWLEYLSFGPMLQRCRLYRVRELADAKRALVLGDGDGRFLVRLLKENPRMQADVIDSSPVMLHLLRQRATKSGVLERVNLHCADARESLPPRTYDLVATHFFLDCFATEELLTLVDRIRGQLTPGARWVVSEFAIPSGTMSLPARLIVWVLYVAFGFVTGLKTRKLPDYAAALTRAGLLLADRRRWLGGLLTNDLWKAGCPPLKTSAQLLQLCESQGPGLLKAPEKKGITA